MRSPDREGRTTHLLAGIFIGLVIAFAFLGLLGIPIREINTSMLPVWFTAIGTTMAAVAAFLAVRATKESMRTNEKTSNAQLVKSFLEIYSSKEMRDAQIRLKEFYTKSTDENGENNIMSYYHDLMFLKNPYDDELDVARRMVKFYFIIIHRLYDRDLIDQETYKMATDLAAKWTFFHVVEPLDIFNAVEQEKKYHSESAAKYDAKLYESIAESLDYHRDPSKLPSYDEVKILFEKPPPVIYD